MNWNPLKWFKKPAKSKPNLNPNLRQGDMSPSERRREAELRQLQADWADMHRLVEAWSTDPDGRARSMARAEMVANIQQSSNARAQQVQQELGVDKVPGGQYLLDGIAYSVFHDPAMKHFTQEEALGEVTRRFRKVTGMQPDGRRRVRARRRK